MIDVITEVVRRASLLSKPVDNTELEHFLSGIRLWGDLEELFQSPITERYLRVLLPEAYYIVADTDQALQVLAWSTVSGVIFGFEPPLEEDEFVQYLTGHYITPKAREIIGHILVTNMSDSYMEEVIELLEQKLQNRFQK